MSNQEPKRAQVVVVETDEAMNEAAHAFIAAIPNNAANEREIRNNIKPALKAAIETWLSESGYSLVKN
jgi:hypothetical protein